MLLRRYHKAEEVKKPAEEAAVETAEAEDTKPAAKPKKRKAAKKTKE